MAHYNTHTIAFRDHTVKTYSILNLTAQQIYVMHLMASGKVIPDNCLQTAQDIQAKLGEMAQELDKIFNQAQAQSLPLDQNFAPDQDTDTKLDADKPS